MAALSIRCLCNIDPVHFRSVARSLTGATALQQLGQIGGSGKVGLALSVIKGGGGSLSTVSSVPRHISATVDVVRAVACEQMSFSIVLLYSHTS